MIPAPSRSCGLAERGIDRLHPRQKDHEIEAERLPRAGNADCGQREGLLAQPRPGEVAQADGVEGSVQEADARVVDLSPNNADYREGEHVGKECEAAEDRADSRPSDLIHQRREQERTADGENEVHDGPIDRAAHRLEEPGVGPHRDPVVEPDPLRGRRDTVPRREAEVDPVHERNENEHSEDREGRREHGDDEEPMARANSAG